jgi:hypothetical protein
MVWHLLLKADADGPPSSFKQLKDSRGIRMIGILYSGQRLSIISSLSYGRLAARRAPMLHHPTVVARGSGYNEHQAEIHLQMPIRDRIYRLGAYPTVWLSLRDKRETRPTVTLCGQTDDAQRGTRNSPSPSAKPPAFHPLAARVQVRGA